MFTENIKGKTMTLLDDTSVEKRFLSIFKY